MQFAVGLISDTHGVFDKAAAEHFKHTGLVIHAGDVGHHGRHRDVLELYAEAGGAPVLAVAGNVDDKLDAADRQLLPQHRLVQVAGWTLLVCHIVASSPTAKGNQPSLYAVHLLPLLGADHLAVDAAAAALIQQLQPDIVVCGHSHKACCWQAGGVCYINPGSAGAARFKLPRTVALLELPYRRAAAAASRSGQPANCTGTGQHPGPQLDASNREGVPGAAAATSRSNRGIADRMPRDVRSRDSKGGVAMHEQHKAAVSNTRGDQGSTGTAAAAAAAAGESKGRAGGGVGSGSAPADAWLGGLHVSFMQLPQKAPPRLAACK